MLDPIRSSPSLRGVADMVVVCRKPFGCFVEAIEVTQRTLRLGEKRSSCSICLFNDKVARVEIEGSEDSLLKSA